jgi:transcription initiation factor TFIIB
MDRDFKNRIIFDIRWLRLKKYQKITWAMKYVTLEEEIRRLTSALNLPRNCADNAVELAKQFVGRGFSPQALAAAALFLSCRMLKVPRPMSDFVNYIEDLEKMKKVIRELSALAVKNVPQIESYVAVIASRINAPPASIAAAVELIKRNKKVLQGRNPWAAAAAALWLSGVDISLLRQFASPSAIKNIVQLLK